ncbi:hypothetical protein KAU11_08235 [Candidatus Babeliales bacterium]|nr:hypothetical protein [Candidatus Babeliales bacterium]
MEFGRQDDVGFDPSGYRAPKSESTLNNFLQYISRGGYVARNLMSGNIQGAARQVGDIIGDTIDAAVPIDLIPEFSREQDYMEFSDVLDSNFGFLGKMDDGALRSTVDFVGGIATDPLTYLTFGAAPAAHAAKGGLKVASTFGDDALRASMKTAEVGKHLSKAGRATLKESPTYVDDIASGSMDEILDVMKNNKNFEQGGMRMRVPFTDISTDTLFAGKALDPLENIGKVASKLPYADDVSTFAKKTLGWDSPSAAGDVVTSQANAVMNNTVKAAHGFLGDKLKGITPAMDSAIDKAMQGVTSSADDAGNELFRSLDDITTAPAFESIDDQVYRFSNRLSQLKDELTPEEYAKSLKMGEDLIKHNVRDFQSAIREGAMSKPMMYTDRTGNRVLLSDIKDQIIDLKDDIKGQRTDVRQQMVDVNKLLKSGVLGADEAMGIRNGLTNDLDDILVRLDESPQQFIEDLGFKLSNIPKDSSPPLYLKRSIDTAEEASEFNQPASSPFKKRKLGTKEDLAEYLNTGKGKIKFGVSQSVAERASQQGTAMGRAWVGRHVAGDTFDALTTEGKQALKDGIDNIAEHDQSLARMLTSFGEGKGARGGFMQVLADTNKVFKPFAVYGALLPKMGGIVRNKLGQISQAASVDATRGSTWGQAKNALGDLGSSFDEAYQGKTMDKVYGAFESALGGVGIKLKPNQFRQKRDAIDAAFRSSNGQLEDAYRILKETDPELYEASRYGVLDGFVKSENLIAEISGIQERSKTRDWLNDKSVGRLDKIASSKFGQVFDTAFNAPSTMFNAVESNGRLGLFLDLRNKGMDATTAARNVQEAFLDYSVVTKENRALRDLIPFAAFITGSVKQQGKLLSKHPAVGVAANQVYGNDDSAPVYPWMEDQAHVRLPWEDTEGNAAYASGLGLPIEALNSVPNMTGGDMGRQFEQNVIGSSHPLLKTAYSAFSGHDPYFRSEYGSYGKDPLTHKDSDAGRAYNVVAGTGMIQPLDSLLRTIGKFTDERKSMPVALLDSLTGIKVQSVDEKRAIKQQLRAYLEANADKYTGFYTKDKSDEEMQKILRIFRNL